MLVGRDTELRAVRDVLAAISGPVGIVLEGEAGIGKTAVWRAGLAEAEIDGSWSARPRLMPTERRVADLVAEGRSNEEVASELFVSVRTVEANLTRIYAKLGIRSRTEPAAIRQASDGRSRSPARPPAPQS